MDSGRSPFQKILKSSAKMGVATFVSRILGLIREQVTAWMFGASGMTDAFFVAFKIPNLLRDLFAEGAFSAAFVPIFSELRLKDEEAAKRLFWSVFVLLSLITGLITILIMIFAGDILELFAPAFMADPAKFEVTVVLIRIMSPFLVLVSLAALFMGALNSLKMFFMPSLAPAFFNVVMILCIVFLPSALRPLGIHEIISMGIGCLLGGTLQLMIQVPWIFIKNYGPRGPLVLISAHTKQIIGRVGIGTIGIASNQINVLVATVLATGSGVGAVSWLNYAFRLFQFPVGILSVSLSGSNLVHFSEAWRSGDLKTAQETLRSSYYLSFFLIIPAMGLLMALSSETVHLIFERGLFHSTDTEMTALALKFYLIGLPFYGLYKIISPTFFALDKPKIPVFISVSSIIANIIFCITLTPRYGFFILALGTSFTMMLNISAQCIFLQRIVGLPLNFFFNIKIVKILLAGFLTFLVTKQVASSFFVLSDPFFLKAAQFVVAGSLGLFAYVILMWLFGEIALKDLWIKIQKRFF